MSGACIKNTFILILWYMKQTHSEGGNSYLANCKTPDDFCCFALVNNGLSINKAIKL